jgi:hypothetical protein
MSREPQPSLMVVPGLAIGPMADGDKIVVGVNPEGEVRAMRENSTHHAVYLLDHVRSMMPRLSRKDRDMLGPKVEELRRMLAGLQNDQ